MRLISPRLRGYIGHTYYDELFEHYYTTNEEKIRVRGTGILKAPWSEGVSNQ